MRLGSLDIQNLLNLTIRNQHKSQQMSIKSLFSELLIRIKKINIFPFLETKITINQSHWHLFQQALMIFITSAEISPFTAVYCTLCKIFNKRSYKESFFMHHLILKFFFISIIMLHLPNKIKIEAE